MNLDAPLLRPHHARIDHDAIHRAALRQPRARPARHDRRGRRPTRRTTEHIDTMPEQP